LLEGLQQSSWNLVCISRHMKPSQRHTSEMSWISNTNITASQFVTEITIMLLKCLNRSSWNWYIYHATWVHFKRLLHKSLQSLIPTLQPFKFLRQNFNIAWTPA
jgi:hypothetical protein